MPLKSKSAIFPITVALTFANSAHAAPPRLNTLAVGSLISPSQAWSTYTDVVTHTASLPAATTSNPEFTALATGLGASRNDISNDAYISNVFSYISNNIYTEMRFELGKGAIGALLDQSGTAFDQVELMKNLLAIRGINSTVNVGSINITANQFAHLTGVFSSVAYTTQIATVSAVAACQLLANGGIPAIVNNKSSCDAVSGNLTSLTMGHVWLTVNGSTYDPAFKQYDLYPGINLMSGSGCTQGGTNACANTLTTAALSGASQGTTNGVAWLSTLNATNINQSMATIAKAIETQISNNNPNLPMHAAGNGFRLIPYNQGVTSANPLYTMTSSITWSGSTPDVFRARAAISLLDINQSFFVDEISGRTIKFYNGSLYLDRTAISATQCTPSSSNCGIFTTQSNDFHGGGESHVSATSKLSVYHAYPSGNFASEDQYQTIQSPLTPIATGANYLGEQIDFIFSIGDSMPSKSSHYSRVATQYPSLVTPTNWSGVNSTQGEELSGTWSDVLVRQTAASRLVGFVLGTRFTRHHAIGVMEASPTFNSATSTGNISLQEPEEPASENLSVFETPGVAGISLTSKSSATDVSGNLLAQSNEFNTEMAIESILESQVTDSFASGRAVEQFYFFNLQGAKFFDVQSGQMNSMLPILQNYDADTITAFNALSASNLEVILPQNANGGCYTLLNAPNVTGTQQSCSTSTTNPEYILGTNSSALLIDMRWKGASDPTSKLSSTLGPAKHSSRVTTNIVDMHDQSLKLHDTIIEDGIGEFPYGLDYILNYSSSDNISEIQKTDWSTTGQYPSASYYYSYMGPGHSGYEGNRISAKVGGGWGSNFEVSAALTENLEKALGRDEALSASSTIAATIALYQLDALGSFPSKLTEPFVGKWLLDQYLCNDLQFKGVDTETIDFIKLPSGSYFPGAYGKGVAQVSGSWSGPYGPVNAPLTYGIGYININVKDETGKSYYFDNTTNKSYLDYWWTHLSAPLVRISNAEGVTANANFTNIKVKYSSSTPDTTIFTGFSNNIGRSATISSTVIYPFGNLAGNTIPADIQVSGVTNEVGASASFSNTSCPPTASAYPSTTVVMICQEFSRTNSLGQTHLYEYLKNSNDIIPSNALGSNYRVRRFFAPLNQSVALFSASYDELWRVSSLTDSKGNIQAYYGTSVVPSNWNFTELKDATGSVIRQEFDDHMRLIANVDGLGHRTVSVYTDDGALLRTQFPNGSAEEYGHDVRGNVTSVCQIPAGRVNWQNLSNVALRSTQCSTSDLLTTIAYVEGPTIRGDQCANQKICNKVSYKIDPKGNRTDYTWCNPSNVDCPYDTGQIYSEMDPKDAAGNRPTTIYNYSPFTGSDNSTFYMMTSKMEKIDSSHSEVTSYTYNPSNHWTLRSETRDSAGLKIQTCFQFDSSGNLISQTQPNANLVSCP